MITNAILDIIYRFVLGVSLVVASFGTVDDNNLVTTSIVTLKTYYNSLNAFLPIDTIVSIVAFSLAFEGIYFIYKLVRWGYQKIPMIN